MARVPWQTRRVAWKQLHTDNWHRVELNGGGALHYVEDRHALFPILVRNEEGNNSGSSGGSDGSGMVQPEAGALVLRPGESIYGLKDVQAVFVKAAPDGWLWSGVNDKAPLGIHGLGGIPSQPMKLIAGQAYQGAYLFGELGEGIASDRRAITLAVGNIGTSGQKHFHERRAYLPAFITGTRPNTVLIWSDDGASRGWFDGNDNTALGVGNQSVVNPLALIGHAGRTFRRARLNLHARMNGTVTAAGADQRPFTFRLTRQPMWAGALGTWTADVREYPLSACLISGTRTTQVHDAGPITNLNNGAALYGDVAANVVNGAKRLDLQGWWVLDMEEPTQDNQCVLYDVVLGSLAFNNATGRYVAVWQPGDGLQAEIVMNPGQVLAPANFGYVRGPPSAVIANNAVLAMHQQQTPAAVAAPGAAVVIGAPGGFFVARMNTYGLAGWLFDSSTGEWTVNGRVRAQHGVAPPY